MKGKTNFKVMLMALVVLSALTIGTVGVVNAQTGGSGLLSLPDVARPAIIDPTSAAELRDLQTVASQEGISLQAAIDRYAWNDNFALAVSKIREANPSAFTAAEIVDSSRAWVGFAGSVPRSARDIINTFTDNHTGVSVEVRTNMNYTEGELNKAIQAIHFSVFNATEVSDAATSFDISTGTIRTSVVLNSTASDLVLNALRANATNDLTNATGSGIANSISTSVVRSELQTLGGTETDTEHLGGESIGCTTGFGTKTTGLVRGISTAGHCGNKLFDDGISLTFKAEHEGTYGDFQWHTGTGTHTDDFYAGSDSGNEEDRRDLAFVAAPTVGQTLCRNGTISYKDCQKVRKLNVCSGQHCNLVQMEQHLSASGDSGGPVYLNYTAYGIHRGWMYDPFWPFKREVFSRADLIDEALGISIATN